MAVRAPWPPELHDPPWPPELHAPPWPTELPDPPWPPELHAPPWPPKLPDPPWPPKSPDPPWPPKLRSAMAARAPCSAMAARAPRSPLRHGRPSPLTRHGSQNGCRPGGLLSCPVPVSLEVSRAPTSPLDGVRCWMHRSGGGSNVRPVFSVSCVSPPLVPIFGQFLFLSSFVIISSQPCVFS